MNDTYLRLYLRQEERLERDLRLLLAAGDRPRGRIRALRHPRRRRPA